MTEKMSISKMKIKFIAVQVGLARSIKILPNIGNFYIFASLDHIESFVKTQYRLNIICEVFRASSLVFRVGVRGCLKMLTPLLMGNQ